MMIFVVLAFVFLNVFSASSTEEQIGWRFMQVNARSSILEIACTDHVITRAGGVGPEYQPGAQWLRSSGGQGFLYTRARKGIVCKFPLECQNAWTEDPKVFVLLQKWFMGGDRAQRKKSWEELRTSLLHVAQTVCRAVEQALYQRRNPEDFCELYREQVSVYDGRIVQKRTEDLVLPDLREGFNFPELKATVYGCESYKHLDCWLTYVREDMQPPWEGSRLMQTFMRVRYDDKVWQYPVESPSQQDIVRHFLIAAIRVHVSKSEGWSFMQVYDGCSMVRRADSGSDVARGKSRTTRSYGEKSVWLCSDAGKHYVRCRLPGGIACQYCIDGDPSLWQGSVASLDIITIMAKSKCEHKYAACVQNKVANDVLFCAVQALNKHLYFEDLSGLVMCHQQCTVVKTLLQKNPENILLVHEGQAVLAREECSEQDAYQNGDLWLCGRSNCLKVPWVGRVERCLFLRAKCGKWFVQISLDACMEDSVQEYLFGKATSGALGACLLAQKIFTDVKGLKRFCSREPHIFYREYMAELQGFLSSYATRT